MHTYRSDGERTGSELICTDVLCGSVCVCPRYLTIVKAFEELFSYNCDGSKEVLVKGMDRWIIIHVSFPSQFTKQSTRTCVLEHII